MRDWSQLKISEQVSSCLCMWAIMAGFEARTKDSLTKLPYCCLTLCCLWCIADWEQLLFCLCQKYYPPDFDPTKIPKLKLERNRQFSIRIMAPFNMRCSTCGEYIYKGKKFNSRKETVETENYLGLYIFRFYIKCPRCVAEIAFKVGWHSDCGFQAHCSTQEWDSCSSKLEPYI